MNYKYILMRLPWARRLVAAVQAELARHAVGRIEISVMANNEAALALWTSLGFQPFREHRVKVLSPADQALAEANRGRHRG